VLWSDAFLAFHSLRPEQVAGKTAAEVFPAEIAAGIDEGDQIVLATRQPFQRVRKTIDPVTGRERWTDTTKTVVVDKEGEILGIIGVTRNVTERKAADEALQRSSERLELALWGAGLGLWDWHIPSGSMEINPQLARLIGLEPTQLTPTLEVWMAHTHPEDLPLVQAAFADAIEGRSENVEVEFRIRHADGSWRWNYARGRAVERDATGRAVRLVGVTRDVTARREAEDQLREREQLLRSISDSMPDGMIYQLERQSDGTTHIRYISAGVEQLWGVTPEQVYASPEAIWSRIHPDDRPAFERAARYAHEHRSRFEIELRVILPDGRLRWSTSRSNAIVMADGRVLRNGVEIDITARKQAEADLRRRLDELLALNQIAQALAGWTSIGDALTTVSGLLRRLFAARAVAVWEYSLAAATLTPLLLSDSQKRNGSQKVPLSPPEFAARLIERQASSIAPLPTDHELLGGNGSSEGPESPTILVALRARSQVLGLLCIAASRPEQAYSAADLSLAQTVAGLLGSAIDNARLFAQARASAAEQERRRLARELHDSVSQSLFAANRTAEMLPLLWELDPEEGRAALEDLGRCTGGALAEMRALLIELRPHALAEAPLHESLGLLLPAAASRGALVVESCLDPTPLLPPDVQMALYRVAQEALSNVGKHARARHAWVRLAVAPPFEAGQPWEGRVTITVADDGRGFEVAAPSPGHFGMLTMRERAADIGAALEFVSAPAAGTTITVTWCGVAPIQEAKR
jgi:PAS domain S-box-containing protein